MHAIWPLLWIWATLYKSERGWGLNQTAENTQSSGTGTPIEPADELQKRIADLDHELTMQKNESKETMTNLIERIVQLERQIGLEAEK